MSGAFGRELSEMLVIATSVLTPDHALLAGELENVVFDLNLDMNEGDNADPWRQLQLLTESPCGVTEGTFAQSLAITHRSIAPASQQLQLTPVKIPPLSG